VSQPLFILIAGVAILVLVVAIAVIARRFNKPIVLTREEVAHQIETFLAGGGGPYDWDDFISIPIADSDLEAIRARCAGLPEEFPPIQETEYCGEGGRVVLRNYVNQLRGRAA